jgi:hypothetical protein
VCGSHDSRERFVVNLVVTAYLPARALLIYSWCVQSFVSRGSRSLTELESATQDVTLGVDSATHDPESSSNKNFFSYERPKQKRVNLLKR